MEEQKVADTGMGYYRTIMSEEPLDVKMEDEEPTPRPMKKQDYFPEDDEGEEPFQTPLTLKKKKVMKPIMHSEDMSESESHAVKAKRDQDKTGGKKKVGRVWF